MLSLRTLILFEHFSVGSQTLWSLATNLGGARQVCGLFIGGWRRTSVLLPGFSPVASKVLILTCIIVVWDHISSEIPTYVLDYFLK